MFLLRFTILYINQSHVLHFYCFYSCIQPIYYYLLFLEDNKSNINRSSRKREKEESQPRNHEKSLKPKLLIK